MMVAESLEQVLIFIDTLSATCRLPGYEYSEVYRNKQNWIDRKYRKAYYNNKRWDFPHEYLRRRC